MLKGVETLGLFLGAHAETDRGSKDFEEDEGADEGEDKHRGNTDKLNPELVNTTAIEQAVLNGAVFRPEGKVRQRGCRTSR